ncbi:MAG: SCO family protein [Pseudomonadota bacterium]
MITESPGAKSSTIIAVAVAVGILAMGAGLWFSGQGQAPQELRATALYPEPRSIEPFELIGMDGGAFGLEALQGEWDLVFFGFTHCPDICPNTLGVLRDANGLLAERGIAPPRVTLISVDPERDDPEVMGQYVTFFDESFRAATGEPEALARFALDLGAAFFVEEHEPGDLDYTVDHSAGVMIVDPAGRLRGQLRPPPDPEAFADDLARLMAG